MHHMRDAVHHDFQWDRDLLFDLFRRNPRPLCNDLDVVVGHVGIGLNGQLPKGNDAPGEKHYGESQHEQTVVQSKINNSTNHLLLRRIHRKPLPISLCLGDDTHPHPLPVWSEACVSRKSGLRETLEWLCWQYFDLSGGGSYQSVDWRTIEQSSFEQNRPILRSRN